MHVCVHGSWHHYSVLRGKRLIRHLINEYAAAVSARLDGSSAAGPCSTLAPGGKETCSEPPKYPPPLKEEISDQGIYPAATSL